MAWSYVPTLSSNLDRVRRAINDTDKDDGALPNKRTFSNEEILATIATEGSWQLAVAACFDMLSAAWATEVSFGVTNGNYSQSDPAKRFAEQAKYWRGLYGKPTATPLGIRTVTTTRTDGYS